MYMHLTTLTSNLYKPHEITTFNHSTLSPRWSHNWSNLMIVTFMYNFFLEETPLPSCEAASSACTNHATSHLYSCIFQTWIADTLLYQHCRRQYPFCDPFRLLGLPLVLKLTIIKSYHGLTEHIQRQYHRHGLSPIIGFNPPSINVFFFISRLTIFS